MEGEAGSLRKRRGERSDDVVDFKATLREVNSLGGCGCVCGCVRACVRVCVRACVWVRAYLCLPNTLEEVLETDDALLLISSFQLLQV